MSITKKCNKCEQELEHTQFYKRKSSLDGLEYTCKTCLYHRTKERRKKFHERHGERRRAEERAKYVPTGGIHGLPPVTEKVCPVCKVLKPRSGYYKKLKTISHKCKECTKLDTAARDSKNVNRCVEKRRKWQRDKYERNPEFRAKVRDHIKRLRERTPAWADMDAIRAVYAECPKGYDVDHVLPLKGKLVSGLHIAGNLQILPASVNRSKSNKFTP